MYNNIVYDFITGQAGTGGYSLDGSNQAGGEVYVYNNTSVDNERGFNGSGGASTDRVLKNNLSQGNVTDYSGTYDGTNSTNNQSGDGTAPGVNTVTGTVIFVNESADNFHLSTSNTLAVHQGTDLSADSNLSFNDDIDGDTRPIGWEWDIGADEAQVTGTNYVWTGNTNGSWENQGNWDSGDGSAGNDGYPDDNTDLALINSTNDSITTAGTVTIGELQITGTFTGTLTMSGTTTFIIDNAVGRSGDLNFTAAGTINHTDNTTVAAGEKKLTMIIDGDFTFGINASINVDFLGYDGDEGPGAPNNATGDGGGYGGVGGDYNGTGATSTTYGSITAPSNIGSGGDGNSGGGAAILTVTGTTMLNGVLSANGEDSFFGAASGGSIYLTTGSMTGSGTLQANGGDDNNSGTGGGGGGRIAVVLTASGADFSSFSGTMIAFGGRSQFINPYQDGAAGTIYQETESQASGTGTLIIDNNNLSTYGATTTLMPSSVNVNNFNNIVIQNNGNLGIGDDDTYNFATGNLITSGPDESFITIVGDTLVSFPATYSISGYTLNTDAVTSVAGDWTVASNGALSHSRNGEFETYKINFTIVGNLTINSGGAVDVDLMGYSYDQGPGTPGNATGDGASYGGMGGDNVTNGTNSMIYGSITAPTNIGSGGDGGQGGGAAILTVTGTTTLNGYMTSDGEDTSSGPSSGGSIYLTTAWLLGSGTMTANGGNDTVGNAGGGGGRIAVILTGTLSDFGGYTGTMNAFGGDANQANEEGAAGTVYMQSQSQGSTDGTLIIDNNNRDPFDFGDGGVVNTTVNGTVSGANVGAVIIRGDATLQLSGTLQAFTVSGTWLNQATQTITAGTVIFDGAQAQAVTTNGGTFFNVDVTNASAAGVTFNDETEFNNFTDTTASSRLTFNAGATYTVSGSLTLDGGSTSTRIVLTSTFPPARFAFSVNGSQFVSFLNVNNSEVNVSGDIVATNSLDNNTDSADGSPHWIFSGINFTYTWTGNGNGTTWELQTNWDTGDGTPGNDGYPDDNQDAAIVNSTNDSITTAGTITIGQFEISGTYTGTLTISGTTTFIIDNAGGGSGDLSFTAAGTITHTDNTTVAAGEKVLRITVDGELTIGPNAQIVVDFRGFDDSEGPGAPSTGFNGGSYGGIGGDESIDGGLGTTYGSIIAPVNVGSGSVTGGGNDGAGGGAVILTVVGTTSIDGTISANGDFSSGGGSGGGIFITTGELTGSGTLLVNGGGATTGAGGGGGRIAIVLTATGADFSSWSGTLHAFGSNGTDQLEDGAAGTIYLETEAVASGQGTLIIDNNDEGDAIGTVTTLMPTTVNLNNFNEIIIRNSGNLAVNADDTVNFTTVSISGDGSDESFVTITDVAGVTFPDPFTISGYALNVDDVTTATGDWTIASSGGLSHSQNGGEVTFRINMTLNGDLVIASGGEINVNAKGFAVNGPGQPSSDFDGGSYGGVGGDEDANGTSDGMTYGSITAPVTLGSNGYGSGSYGGGAVVLTVTGTTTLNGLITTTGGVSSSGGSGGSIYLTTARITGGGTLRANGGAGNTSGGGGGGHMAVILTASGADFSNYTGTMNAFGGNGPDPGDDGAAGTVYWQSQPQGSTDGTLLIRNFTGATVSSIVVTTINGTVSGTDVGDVLIQNGATLDLSGTLQTFTVSGTWLNQATQTITAGTVIFDGAQAQAVTTNGGTFFNIEVTNASAAGVTFNDETSFEDFTDTTAGSRLTFEAGSTYTINGTLNLNGQATGTRIVLDSTDGLTRFDFVVAAGAQSVSYVDVSNSQVSGTSGDDITAFNSFNRTNTDAAEASPHWIFVSTGPLRGAAMVVEGDW